MVAQTKLTDEVIQAICARKRADPTLTQDMLAEEFNLNRNSIKKALVMLHVPAGEETGIRLIDYELIDRSSLNPRKTFAEAELAELAESIAVNGLLQNLVVRTAPEGRFILVAGERRLRAIGLLRDEARWDEPLPCRVIEADDGTHLALALLENLQRQDVAPLEEADAFVQLQQIDPAAWTAQAIAAKIGRTSRYVYGRLALANKLAPEARAALAAGRINIEAARILTSVDAEKQVEVLTDAADYDDDGTHEIPLGMIKAEIERNLISVEDAIFDATASGLEIIELGGTRYFAERKAAIQLQLQAVKAKAKVLKKSWAFVTVLEPGQYFYSHEWASSANKEKAGVVIKINSETYEINVHEGLIPKVKAAPKTFDQKEYQAKKEQARLDREAQEKAELDRYTALAPNRPTDWPPDEAPAGQRCFDGCKWRVMLGYSAPVEFHVCTKPDSPRAGLLTREDQGGNGCFEVA